MKDLCECLDSFSNWLKELENADVHRHMFTPFNLKSESFAFIDGNSNDIAIKRGSFLYKDWAWFDNELNRQSADKETQISDSMKKEKRFLEIFYRASKKFVEELIPNSQDN